MTDCPNAVIRDLLPDLVHGRLTASDRERVEAHLASCEPCAEELALLRALHGVMLDAPPIDVSRIVAALPAPTQATPASTRWRRRGVAAALAVAAGLSAIMLSRDADPGNRVDSVVVAGRGARGASTRASSIVDSTGVAPSDPRPSTPTPSRRTTAAPANELAVGGELADLSDTRLASLLAEIETMDAMLAGEPDEALPSAERIAEDGR